MNNKKKQESKNKGYQIKDLKIALKDLEPMVKGTDRKGRLFLINGNNSLKKSDTIEVDNGDSFRMRRIEAWGNWLLCVVFIYAHKQDYTFQDDGIGDGIILNKTTGRWFQVEHVSAMDYRKGEDIPKGDDRLLWAINKKIEKTKKNPNYAKDKSLVVFFDGAEEWHPNKVGRYIDGKHEFACVYGIGLISIENDEYTYSVTEFNKTHSPTFIVKINQNFTDWNVMQI